MKKVPKAIITALTLMTSVTLGPSSAAAQTAPPTLQKSTPSGVQRGRDVTLTIVGTNIGDATRILFSQPGITSRITATKEVAFEKMVVPKGVVRTDAPIEDGARRFEVTAFVSIEASVPHGVYGFKVQTPLGVSNQLRFAVSAYPGIKDREPNGIEAPQATMLPAALVGTLGKPGDVDAYRFPAQAGEEMVFEVISRPLGARLDSVVRLLDESGATVAENNDNDLSRDSVLTWRFARTGRYTLTIEDVELGGGADGYAYRVHAGALPYLAGIFPLGVALGRPGNCWSAASISVATPFVSRAPRYRPVRNGAPHGDGTFRPDPQPQADGRRPAPRGARSRAER